MERRFNSYESWEHAGCGHGNIHSRLWSWSHHQLMIQSVGIPNPKKHLHLKAVIKEVNNKCSRETLMNQNSRHNLRLHLRPLLQRVCGEVLFRHMLDEVWDF